MDDDEMAEIEKQLYEEAYEDLTGDKYEGSIEDLYNKVDAMEFKGCRRKF